MKEENKIENKKENVFLAKLHVMLEKFNEIDSIIQDIDEMIKKQPDNQQQIDYLLSDYYHILENEDISDETSIKVARKIHDARLIRRDESYTARLISVYEKNKNRVQYSNKMNRDFFRQSIEQTISNFHEDYKYRVLTNVDLDNLKKSETRKAEEKQTTKRRKSGLPDKEEIIECFKNNMKNKDIAAKFNIDPSVVSRLRGAYGFPTRKYNKKG